MLNVWTKNAEMYVHLFADCMPVKGASVMAIYDLTRNDIILLPQEYYEWISNMASDKIGKLIAQLQDEEKERFVEFIGFLYTNEYITFVEDPSIFPPLEETWDMPAIIQNAVIDVNLLAHDFNKIFKELDTLGCHFVQIRCFSNLLNEDSIYALVSSCYHTSVQSIELLLKYNACIADKFYIKLVEDHPIISSLIIHSALEEKVLDVDYGCNEVAGEYIKKQIQLVTEIIDSHHHCGIIAIGNFCAPTVSTFFENKLFNGCLNRKISIDALGEIKNCPSMPESYGNISNTSLDNALNGTAFKNKWKITKDQIEVCKDCQFRYACTDCRAFVEKPADLYSKPLKCGYDPYNNEWKDWSDNPLKQKAMQYYSFL